MFECAVNGRGGRITENWCPLNHYTRSAHEKNLCKTGPEEFVRWTKGQLCVGFLGTLGLCDKWAWLSAVSDNWRWNLGFWVWSHNQKTEFRVAHFPVTSTKEGPNEQIKSEIHAHNFFWFRGNCSQGVCATRTDCDSNILPTPKRLRNRNCKHVVPSPRQCAKSHIIRCEGIFGSTYHSASPHTVQPSVLFLFIPQAQNPPQRTSFWDSWKFPGSCDEGFEQHLKWRLSPLLLRVAATLESLYSITRSLFWRG